MTFDARWHDLLEQAEDLASSATLLTPLSRETFRMTDVREDNILIEYCEVDRTTPLQRDHFEILFGRVRDARGGFDFDRLPPNAEPYATVLSLLPPIAAETDDGLLRETDVQTPSPLVVARNEQPVEAGEKETKSSSEPEAAREDLDPTIKEMMKNMGDPRDRIACPIDGCQYSHRSAASVASHVSGSSTDKHIWANTAFAGWRDFVRQHG
jgi:hypothetical protein